MLEGGRGEFVLKGSEGKEVRGRGGSVCTVGGREGKRCILHEGRHSSVGASLIAFHNRVLCFDVCTGHSE